MEPDTSESTGTPTDTVIKDSKDTDGNVTLVDKYAYVKDKNNSGTKELRMGASFNNPTNKPITIETKLIHRFSNTGDQVSDIEKYTIPPGTTEDDFGVLELKESQDYFTEVQRQALLENEFEFEVRIVE